MWLSVSVHLSVCPLSQVSATFAASLVISPSLGNLILSNYSEEHGERKVIALATLVSVLNLAFILFCVPESLPESVRKSSWGSAISWEQADPFAVRLWERGGASRGNVGDGVEVLHTSLSFVHILHTCMCICAHVQWDLSIKDTLKKGHLSNEDTVCSSNHVELCTNLPLNTGQPAGSQWCPV